MGAAKELMIMRHDLVQAVTPIGVRAGALEECWLHGEDNITRTWDSEAERRMYAMATKAWNDGELFGDREDVVAAVKEAIDNAPYDCWRCEKLKAE